MDSVSVALKLLNRWSLHWQRRLRKMTKRKELMRQQRYEPFKNVVYLAPLSLPTVINVIYVCALKDTSNDSASNKEDKADKVENEEDDDEEEKAEDGDKDAVDGNEKDSAEEEEEEDGVGTYAILTILWTLRESSVVVVVLIIVGVILIRPHTKSYTIRFGPRSNTYGSGV